MKQMNDEDIVASLLSIRSKLENNISEFGRQQEEIRQKIDALRDQKSVIQEARLKELQDLYSAEIDLLGARKRVAIYEQYLTSIKSSMNDMSIQIKDHVKTKDFEGAVLNLNNQLEAAMVFYSEDNLQMELMKRGNATRERRVECTRLESEIKDLTRRIENRKREAEQARLERERLKREEEERLKIAEDNAKMMQEKREFEGRASSFRGLSEPTHGPDPSRILAWDKPKASNVQESEQPTGCQKGLSKGPTTNFASTNPELSFSQYLRW